MGISVDQMRVRINELYDGHFTKVLTMPEHQVIAIYYQKLSSGAFDEKKKADKQRKKNKQNADYYYQMSIFDYDANGNPIR